MQYRPFLIHALSPLHIGTGAGVGIIDLPIAREAATGLPFVPGSSIKGVLRDISRGDDDEAWKAAFGPPPPGDGASEAHDHAGALMITDASILMLPARSMMGIYAWVTCPLVLRRWHRELADLVGLADVPETIPSPGPDAAFVCPGTAVVVTQTREHRLVLDALDFKATEDGEATAAWARLIGSLTFDGTEWRDALAQRFVIVDDDAFSFLCETGMELRTRIRLKDDTKTVQRGGLWNEEALPSETVLGGVIVADDSHRPGKSLTGTDMLDMYVRSARTLQIGGMASTGYGLARFVPVTGRNAG